MTMEQLAKRLSSHKGYMSGLIRGKVAPPSAKFIRRMAQRLKVQLTPLLLMAWVEKAPEEIREYVKAKVL
jgi:transcriptional regulator with XRE-family HTH domain